MRRVIFTQGLLAVVAASISFLIAPPHAAGAWTQWTVANGGNGHYYDVIVDRNARGTGLGISWEAAQAGAVARGGYLASITTAAENTFVFNLAKSNANNWDWHSYGAYWGPWIGAQQNPLPTTWGPSYVNSNWSWVTTGEPWSYASWGTLASCGSDQPNDRHATSNGNPNGGEEDKAHYYGLTIASGYGWNDIASTTDPSGYSPVSYVVEKVPEPSTLILLGVGAVSLLAYAGRRRKATA